MTSSRITGASTGTPTTLAEPSSKLASTATPALSVHDLAVGYPKNEPVVQVPHLVIPAGKVTALLGANGSGKSTLLRTIARAIDPLAGRVELGSTNVAELPRREFARAVSMLAQSPSAPDGITVRELCQFGRHPHRSFLARESLADRDAVADALASAQLSELADVPLEQLSGGQRQRAWIALALAQDAPIMLLDEPTSYLDVAHQVEVLELLRELNRAHGTTIVMVLHDVNQAGQYADHLVAIADGAVHIQGGAHEVLTADTMRAVFGLNVAVIEHPVTGTPLCLPLGVTR